PLSSAAGVPAVRSAIEAGTRDRGRCRALFLYRSRSRDCRGSTRRDLRFAGDVRIFPVQRAPAGDQSDIRIYRDDVADSDLSRRGFAAGRAVLLACLEWRFAIRVAWGNRVGDRIGLSAGTPRAPVSVMGNQCLAREATASADDLVGFDFWNLAGIPALALP